MRSAAVLEVTPEMSWRALAACSPSNADWFFTSDRNSGGGLSENNRRALRICRTCLVKSDCLADALADPEKQSRIAGGELVRKGAIVERGKR